MLSPEILTPTDLTKYVDSILDPSSTAVPRLQCPATNITRYASLVIPPSSGPLESQPIEYFIALDLRNCLPVLPRLLGSILSAIHHLNPASCFLSIIEGNSPDGTADVLAALRPHLTRLSIRHNITTHHPLNPLGQSSDRFSSLATLRNLALAPLPSLPTTPTTTILFINDVAACPDDLLELLLQRVRHAAHLACAMDWVGADPRVFYDSYIARAINGDLFFEVPPETTSWARATELFWNEPVARGRMERGVPFQVFACWNGAVAMAAEPVVEGGVRFRGTGKDECHAGEPQTFCKDLWFGGWGRVMVVPSVNLEYEDGRAEGVKREKGFVGDWVAKGDEGEAIEWKGPPDLVKCMPTFNRQSWEAWNQSLV